MMWGGGGVQGFTLGIPGERSRAELTLSPPSPWETRKTQCQAPSVVPSAQAPRDLSQLPLGPADAHTLLHTPPLNTTTGPHPSDQGESPKPTLISHAFLPLASTLNALGSAPS